MQQQEQQKSMLENETTPLNYGDIFWRRKTMIIALCVVSVLATMGVSLMLPKYYQSQAMILAIAPESGGLGAALSANPLAGLTGSIGGLSTPVDKLLVFLKSRTIAEMMVTRFDLLHVLYQDKWDPVKGAWKDPEKPPLMEDAVKYLSKRMTQFKKSREGTITIIVEWKDPKLAAEIANYYVAALAEFMKDKSVNTTVQVIDRAVPAGKKSSPQIGQNMMVAGFLSLLIGMFIAMILEKRGERCS